MSREYTPRGNAAAEALENFQAATAERKRSQIMAFTERDKGVLNQQWLRTQGVDVTEDVVTILDMVCSSMEWGSGFFSDEDLSAFINLCDLLKFDAPAEEQSGCDEPTIPISPVRYR